MTGVEDPKGGEREVGLKIVVYDLIEQTRAWLEIGLGLRWWSILWT